MPELGQSSVQGLVEETRNAVREVRNRQRRDIYQSGDSESPASFDNETDDIPVERRKKMRFDSFINELSHIPVRMTKELMAKLLMLSAYGFLCSSDGSAECFCCHFRIPLYEWLRRDNPQIDHYQTSHCRFLRGEETGNVPLSPREKIDIQSTSCPQSNAATSSVFDTPPREDAVSRESPLPLRFHRATRDTPSTSRHDFNVIPSDNLFYGTPGANDPTPPATPERR